MNFIKDKQNTLLIGLILIAGTVLRILFPFEIPFTYDEFSALFRTYFSSFSELIDKGVKIDGHPAGIQVFLYYWTKWFGYHEFIVKLPFIAAGIGSVYLIYRIGIEWFNNSAGLLSAVFMAGLQYTVMYSQIARPYISGLFFTLLMTFYWYKVVFKPNEPRLRNLILFTIAGSLCAYNHHFSLLQATIIGFTGLFFIKKENIIGYSIAGISIFILYIPHLPIFFYQLNQGGVEGWLGKPTNDFILRYIGWAFHYSYFIYALVAGLFLLGMYHLLKSKPNLKFIVISACWFGLPFLIGFFYSKYINAVIQFSVLIFSFPFFLFLIFGSVPDLNFKSKFVLIISSLIIITLSLIYERDHYNYFYNSPYEQILVQHDEARKKYKDSIVSVIDSHKKISNYYFNEKGFDTTCYHYNSFDSIKTFIQFLSRQETPFLYFGCHSGSHPVIVPIIQDFYPYLKSQTNYFGGFAYQFSKSADNNNIKPIFETKTGFEHEIENWSKGGSEFYIDTISFEGSCSYFFDSTHQWGPGYQISLDEIIEHENNFIDISVMVWFPEKVEEILLVSEIKSGDESIDWRSASSNLFTSGESKFRWIKVHHSIKLSDIDLNYTNMTLKTYIYNINNASFYIDDFNIKVRNGNPNLYGLFQRIERNH